MAIKGTEKKVKVIGKPPHWGIELTKKGVFNLDKMYKLFMNWYTEHKYTPEEKGYTSKPLIQKGEEIILEYKGYRDVTTYFRFWIEVDIWGLKLKKVGNNYQGDLRVRFRGWIEKDHKKKWRHFEFFRQIYDLYIVKDKLSKYKKKIDKETKDLIKKTKKILGLITK